MRNRSANVSDIMMKEMGAQLSKDPETLRAEFLDVALAIVSLGLMILYMVSAFMRISSGVD